jgi:hypothetical protein
LETTIAFEVWRPFGGGGKIPASSVNLRGNSKKKVVEAAGVEFGFSAIANSLMAEISGRNALKGQSFAPHSASSDILANPRLLT